jgi:hypothetical protein
MGGKLSYFLFGKTKIQFYAESSSTLLRSPFPHFLLARAGKTF